jgi:hypothetical protein
VAHCINRTASRECYADGISDCRLRQDITSSDVLFDQAYNGLAGALRIVIELVAVGPQWSVAGQCHSKGFGHEVHGVCGRKSGANAWPRDGMAGHFGELGKTDLAGFIGPDTVVELLDINVPAAAIAAELIPARQHYSGKIEPPSRHQLPRRGLVTRREQHHSVEFRTLDLDFDIVDKQIP